MINLYVFCNYNIHIYTVKAACPSPIPGRGTSSKKVALGLAVVFCRYSNFLRHLQLASDDLYP